uniref:EF-hand domain-containing protein n=1 Tax=Plectus sambesii TaxID=2011161 RepID=A0A914W2L0_9BILA
MGNIQLKAGLRKVSQWNSLEKAVDKEMEDQKLRYKPESLDELVKNTHFDRKELKRLYQGFKQNCPNGYVTVHQFKEIFQQLFCIGRYADPSTFAQLVFDTFDEDGNARISFSEFAEALSILNRGTVEQRLEWIFSLYDNKHRGYIIEDDFYKVISAVYELMGIQLHRAQDGANLREAQEHVRNTFRRMDHNRDGKITMHEFLEGCKESSDLEQSLDLFKTVW